jgi:iron(III) transport system ATP-binding protein
MKTILELKNVYHAYDDNLVVKDISFRLRKGSIGCLLGHSGCGKTTVLRAIAGFEKIVDGEILLKGKTVSDKGASLPPEKRNIGMVFQDYALFPHLTVFENIALALRRVEKSKKIKMVSRVLDTVHLQDVKGSYPHELSGGQQQRVALARALVSMPKLLLMDEPFSNLDVNLREKISMEVRDILKEFGITALIVTHNQHEAFAIADEIGVMNDGQIQQWDTAYNIYHKPENTFVANFIGEGVLLHAVVENDRQVRTGLGTLEGDMPAGYAAGTPVHILIRPEDVIHADESNMKAKVINKAFRGESILYTLLLDNGDKVLSLATSHHEHPTGSMVGIRLEVDDIILFTRSEKLERQRASARETGRDLTV